MQSLPGFICALVAGLVWCLGVVAPAEAMDDEAYVPTVFVTGGNRGLGFEFVRQYADAGWNVIATARKPAKADDLQALAKGLDESGRAWQWTGEALDW